MSFRIDYQRVRVAAHTDKKTGDISDDISGEQAKFARGSRLRIEFGLFYKDGIADAGQITTARLRILASNDPDANVAMDKTIGVTSMNLGISLADWQTGESSKSHLIFEFSAAETAESAFGGSLGDASDHWFLLTQGVNDDFLLAGLIASFDAGYTAVGAAPPVTGTAATLDQISALIDARLQDYIKRINGAGVTVTFESPSTKKLVKLGAADNGELLVEDQPDS